MALRPGDRKTQAILAAVIAAGVLLNGAWVVQKERSRAGREIQQQALLFAELSRVPIATADNRLFHSGFYKFREVLKDRMRLEPSVERIQFVDMDGKIRFDSDRLDDAQASAAPVVEGPGAAPEPSRLAVIRSLETRVLPLEDRADGTRFEVVAPYVEDWGRHEFTVIYRFDVRRSVDLATRRLVAAHLLPGLVAALTTIAAALALLRRVA
jgi:hypothetical protein